MLKWDSVHRFALVIASTFFIMLGVPLDATAQEDPWASLDVSGASGFRLAGVTVFVQCSGGARSSNPDADIWIYVKLFVDNNEISSNVAQGYQPSTTASANVEMLDRARDLRCELQTTGAQALATGTLEPRRPNDVRSTQDNFTYTAPGNYLRQRIWQVYDQFNLTYTYPGTPMWESFDITSNGCNMTITTNPMITLSDFGDFGDRYGNITGSQIILTCQTNPACVTQSTQTYNIAGYMFNHGVTWRCNDVQISRP